MNQQQMYRGNELRDFLTGFVKMPRFNTVESVGIIRDAEMVAQSTFQSVQSSLGNSDLPIPSQVEIASAGELETVPEGAKRAPAHSVRFLE